MGIGAASTPMSLCNPKSPVYREECRPVGTSILLYYSECQWDKSSGNIPRTARGGHRGGVSRPVARAAVDQRREPNCQPLPKLVPCDDHADKNADDTNNNAGFLQTGESWSHSKIRYNSEKRGCGYRWEEMRIKRLTTKMNGITLKAMVHLVARRYGREGEGAGTGFKQMSWRKSDDAAKTRFVAVTYTLIDQNHGNSLIHPGKKHRRKEEEPRHDSLIPPEICEQSCDPSGRDWESVTYNL